ncbi:hypothetical protein BST61_g1380 [Cercospora zeina]
MVFSCLLGGHVSTVEKDTAYNDAFHQDIPYQCLSIHVKNKSHSIAPPCSTLFEASHTTLQTLVQPTTHSFSSKLHKMSVPSKKEYFRNLKPLENPPEDPECPICRDDMTEATQTACNHTFCYDELYDEYDDSLSGIEDEDEDEDEDSREEEGGENGNQEYNQGYYDLICPIGWRAYFLIEPTMRIEKYWHYESGFNGNPAAAKH